MTTDKKIIKARVGVLELARQLGNVSEACKIMGYSRDTFYRYKELYETGGEEALKDVSRRKPIPKNRVAPEIEEAVCELAIDNPALGQVRASNELRKRGLFVSPGGFRSIWLRHDLVNDAGTHGEVHTDDFPEEPDDQGHTRVDGTSGCQEGA